MLAEGLVAIGALLCVGPVGFGFLVTRWQSTGAGPIATALLSEWSVDMMTAQFIAPCISPLHSCLCLLSSSC